MKFGVSTYSLNAAIQKKEMTVLDVIDWIASVGGEHVEIVPIGFSLVEDQALTNAIVRRAKDAGIDVSNYAVGGNFVQSDRELYEKEIEKVKREVEVAYRLGVKTMRHDVAWRSIPETSVAQFDADLPKLAEACARVADYAATMAITTSVENHGYFVQASDRVQRLIHAVNRPNYKTTIDVGNFLCADEDPVVAVKKNLPYACIIHLKDFYVRRDNPGTGWFPSAGGKYLRGAIFGHGDINLSAVMQLIRDSGYNGYASLEFEGMEECRQGAKLGLESARRLWEATASR